MAEKLQNYLMKGNVFGPVQQSIENVLQNNQQLRAELQTALLNLATGDLRTSATALLGKLGYASHKTLELPTQPQAFAKEVENLLGGSKQLNPAHASLADWQSAAFLFQLTNDDLPALAAGQASLLKPAACGVEVCLWP
jgi:hypothetical protein